MAGFETCHGAEHPSTTGSACSGRERAWRASRAEAGASCASVESRAATLRHVWGISRADGSSDSHAAAALNVSDNV